ncbi:OmpA family protein [Thalassotalea psychrophila]|uniref:OmpA family protein n=1 Tax=Thalassotalea psychrophila TaxID=3065647 RepID=A0ABY9TRP3_9GAMM|nr:OmpA family protein [Colwelliaceae bacterium SQ149]
MKKISAISLLILISACHSNANFKSANLIKPHLDAEIIEEPQAPVETMTVAAQPFVYFDFNSSELNEESMQILDTHLSAMKALETGQIVLQGHTDQVGGEDFNFDLGKERALSVWVYLVNAGVNQERLTATTMGKGDPKRQNINPTTDRHVEIIY